MSTDAFFFFHMDPENKGAQCQPTASTSSAASSVVSQRFLVEYSPKPVYSQPVAAPAVPVAASTTQAIHRWLAGQRAYHDSERSSFSESESEADDDEVASSSSSTDSESDEDQIYLRPRRQHSSPSIPASVSLATPASASASRKSKAWPVSAAKPALPVLDLREATAFTTEQDKSHWSDDEESLDDEEEEWQDDDDLPALDADVDVEVDTGAASSSTRSLPIPIFNPTRTNSQPLLLRKNSGLWDDSYQSPIGRRAPCKAIAIQEGQSFYTPWIAGFIAQNN